MRTLIKIPVCYDWTDTSIDIPQSTFCFITAITNIHIWKHKKDKESQGDGLYMPAGSSRAFDIDGSDWGKSLLVIEGTANVGFDGGRYASEDSSGIFDNTFNNTFN
jgi:hypothetical protein